jgi:hypothetical protein
MEQEWSTLVKNATNAKDQNLVILVYAKVKEGY